MHRNVSRHSILFAISLVVSTHLCLSQVKIKERLEINPKSKDRQSGQISSDVANTITFRRGGTLKLGLIFPDHTTDCTINGRSVPNDISSQWITWGTFHQWSSASFTLVDPSAPISYVSNPLSSMLIGVGNWEYITFAFSDAPDDVAVAYGLELEPDSSEAMPADWYLNYEYGPGNPYDPSLAPSITIPFETSYRLIIQSVKPSANDELVLLSPERRSLMRNVAAHEGDTLVLGPYEEGTELKLGLVSGAGTLVKGDTLYPQFLEYGGPYWRMNFEDWTDLDFDDVKVIVEPKEEDPDHLELWSDNETVYYGDTVDVEITPTDIDSAFAPLGSDSDYEFSVELINGTDQYGELLYQGQNGTYFEHIPSIGGAGVGVEFAANQLEPDSTVDLWFHLTATYIGGGGGATKIVGTGNSHGKGITRSMRERKMIAIHKPIKSSTGVAKSIKSLPSPTQAKMYNIAAPANAKEDRVNESNTQSTISKAAKTNAVIANTVTSSTKPVGGPSLESIPFTQFMENVWGWGVGEPESILLGQTIYLQAVAYPARPTTIFFVPLSNPSERLNPQLAGVRFTVESESGDKLGIYYDEKLDEDGNSLRSDMLRITGRFWKQIVSKNDKYVVEIAATASGRSGKIQFEVKKPARLFDEDVFDYPYDHTRNIRNEPLDIDSLCIWYGGRIGIPPQVIKGQMFQESDKTGNQFNPSYRYEPWADYGFASKKLNPSHWKDYRKQPFWVTGELQKPMGLGKDVPMDHRNVRPLYYTTDAMTIANYVIKYWPEYWKSAKSEMVEAKDLTQMWRAKFRTYFVQSLLFPISPPYALPQQRATSDLQQCIKDKYSDLAQTRKSASYGLIQLMYTTAFQPLGFNIGKPIDGSSSPEELNDEVIEMPFYQVFTEKNLTLQLNEEHAPNLNWNWPGGWENTWKNSFGPYNRSDKYATDVFNNAKYFYPQPQQGDL
jgi:hypothetical protein